MKKIYKYPLLIEDEQGVEMPFGAVILCVQVQGSQPCLWALVNPEAEKESRRIRTIGTGHPIEADPGYYVGTYQISGGALVFHVFDKRS